MLDTIGRRLRFRPRDPKNAASEITERDLDIFAHIRRFGISNSLYLHLFLGGELNYLQKRLGKLYDAGYLDHFEEQADSRVNWKCHIAYAVTDKATQALTDANRLELFCDHSDAFPHRYMRSCVMQSIALLCKKRGLVFIPRSEILSKKNNPFRLPITATTYLYPDDLFGIQYADGSKRRFVVEIDRGTEPHDGLDRKSSLELKVADYTRVMRNRTYYDTWGMVGMMVLIFTTSKARVGNIFSKDLKDNPYAERYACAYYPTFQGKQWRMPYEILEDVLDPYQHVKGTFDITKSGP